jgi:hypothetical protein
VAEQLVVKAEGLPIEEFALDVVSETCFFGCQSEHSVLVAEASLKCRLIQIF